MKKLDPNRPYRRTEIDIAFAKRKAIMQKEALIRGGDGRALYIDCYTGKTLRGGDPYDYEHLRSAEELYNKYKHILSDKEIAIIVNCPENVGVTLRVINQSKGKRSMEEWMQSDLNKDYFLVDKTFSIQNIQIADCEIDKLVKDSNENLFFNNSVNYTLCTLGVAAVGGIFGLYKVFSIKDGNRIALLGMQNSGKTYFLDFLRGQKYSGRQTLDKEKYEAFNFETLSGKRIYIKKGEDIGGADDFIYSYESIILESDIIFYFFDINKYLKNNLNSSKLTYQRDCDRRFELIHTFAESKKIVIVASHKDLCQFSDLEIREKFGSLVNIKRYKKIFENVIYINLTDKSQLNKFVDTIFK